MVHVIGGSNEENPQNVVVSMQEKSVLEVRSRNNGIFKGVEISIALGDDSPRGFWMQ